MNKYLFKKVRSDIKEHYKLYILYIIILFISLFRLNYYIFSPGSLVDLTNRINVENSYKVDGSFNLTYVTTRHATILTYLMSYIIPNWDIESIDNMRIDNESESEIFDRGKISLKETSYDAVIAAFDEAGIAYDIKNTNVTITHVFDFAKSDLKVGDIIKKVNNNIVNSVEDVSNILKNLNVDDEINLEVLRKEKTINSKAKVVEKDNKKVIGVSISTLKDIETKPKVDFIFEDNESGSSRGLMCALDIYNKITEYDLTKGDIIAGTGTIKSDGTVIEIDGVKYKLMGAVKEGAKVFIVPSNNYEEALKLKNDNNYKIEIIEADNLHNVIKKLESR